MVVTVGEQSLITRGLLASLGSQRRRIDNPNLEADLLMCFALGLSERSRLYLLWDQVIKSEDSLKIGRLAERRLSGEPMAYILGYKHFWKHRFKVGSGVLVPRSDSESLIELVLKMFPDNNRRLLFADLGVGSGCLAISILKEYPQARAWGCDISQNAINITRMNSELLSVNNRLSLSLQSWTKRLLIPDRLDFIISNPPYISSGDLYDLPVRMHESVQALSGGASGLEKFYEIMKMNYLRSNGLLFFEVGRWQRIVTEDHGLRKLAEKKDLNKITRAIALCARK